MMTKKTYPLIPRGPRLSKEDLELRDTSILVLCARIKESFFEGFADCANQSCCLSPTYAEAYWNSSSAKKVHDILLNQAKDQ